MGNNKIKVAIIDSGIENNKNFRGSITGGISIKFNKKINSLVYDEDLYDVNGHGTACAYIIYSICSNIEFYSIKVLNEKMQTHSLILLKALEHLLNIDCNIINLSLATLDFKYRNAMENVCNKLINQGKIIIASYTPDEADCLPASIPGVIGVKGFEMGIKDSYWYDNGKDMECVADMTPLLVPGLNSELFLFGSTSKAAAMMSGHVCAILDKNRNISNKDLLQELSAASVNIRDRLLNYDYRGVSEEVMDRRNEYEDIKLNKIKEIIEKKIICNDIFNQNLLTADNSRIRKEVNYIIESLEQIFQVNFIYFNITYRDFISIYTIADLLSRSLYEKRD